VSKIKELFEGTINLKSLALFRMFAGAGLFLHYLSMHGQFQFCFGPDGLLGARFIEHVPGVFLEKPDLIGADFLSRATDGAVISFVYYTLLVSSLSYALGLFTRWAGALALACHYVLIAQNHYVFWGWSLLISPLILYSLLSPVTGAVYSLDRWRRHGSFWPRSYGEYSGPALPLRLLQAHLLCIYIVAAWPRFVDPNWLDGTMLYSLLTDPLYSRFPGDWRAAMPLQKVFCYSVWFLELAVPAGLIVKRTRRYFVWGFLAMHFGFEIFSRIGYWDFLMLGALCSFLDHDDQNVSFSSPAI
jgi:hypothetical protein